MYFSYHAESSFFSKENENKKNTPISFIGKIEPVFLKILTPSAIQFIAELHEKFNPIREKLLSQRKEIQENIDKGQFPTFLEETKHIRDQQWAIAPIPEEILDRRVEITGPVDRKVVINALNSGAQVFMADFEDAHSPTWRGTIEGQVNLYDAIRKDIHYASSQGKIYTLKDKVAVLFVRPRGWHLSEKHVLIDGKPISASLFDFGLHFFHNARELIRQGTRPYYYLPKLENYFEARLWNDVFNFSEDYLKINRGTIRTTVLIETVLAAFQMDEVLYELRDHSVGLNCGRWDYIFSFIKKFKNYPQFVLPDRSQITMNADFLKSYCRLLIKTCHRRGAHAIGGMAAQIPIKNDSNKNDIAMAEVISDKKREINLGHDGTWVAHPALVGVARKVFDQGMRGPNQIHRKVDSENINETELLKVPQGKATEVGLKTNINISLLYLESWLRGIGCVPLYNLMEDAATAEISRTQIWQWIRHGRFHKKDFDRILNEEIKQIKKNIGNLAFESGRFELAAQILSEIVRSEELVEFLTLNAYPYL